MEDEDKLARDVTRGSQAKTIMDSELFIETFEYLDQAYTDAWKSCKTPELREAAWALRMGAERFKDHLATVLRDGQLAARQITELVARRGKRAA